MRINRFKILWRFCSLLGKAREIELEWQRIQQDEHDAFFAWQAAKGNDDSKYAYKKGFAEGVKWCLARFS